MKKYLKNSKGFTVIEALVAITVLVISVIGPMALAARSLNYSNYVRDEITAFYLANEAVDVIRNIRDTNIISGSADWLAVPGENGAEVRITDKCSGSAGCYFDVWKKPPDLKTAFVSGESTTLNACLNQDGLVRFGYNFDWPNMVIEGECSSTKIDQTLFTRNIFVDLVSENEIRVISTVYWTSRAGLNRSVTITENLFKLKVI